MVEPAVAAVAVAVDPGLSKRDSGAERELNITRTITRVRSSTIASEALPPPPGRPPPKLDLSGLRPEGWPRPCRARLQRLPRTPLTAVCVCRTGAGPRSRPESRAPSATRRRGGSRTCRPPRAEGGASAAQTCGGRTSGGRTSGGRTCAALRWRRTTRSGTRRRTNRPGAGGCSTPTRTARESTRSASRRRATLRASAQPEASLSPSLRLLSTAAQPLLRRAEPSRELAALGARRQPSPVRRGHLLRRIDSSVGARRGTRELRAADWGRRRASAREAPSQPVPPPGALRRLGRASSRPPGPRPGRTRRRGAFLLTSGELMQARPSRCRSTAPPPSSTR